MLRLLKKMGFPCVVAAVLALLAWHYRTVQADAFPEETIYKNGAVTIRISTVEQEARSMTESVFRVAIADSQGEPIQADEVTLKIFMPKMFCGEFRADIASVGTGVYEAKAIPVMSGRWEALADVQVNGVKYEAEHLFHVAG